PAEPLVAELAWRLRVLSARALSIVMNRDVQNFEAVMAFLDATHCLLPGLVPAIKHMKIQFGLKTMLSILLRML
uniref:TERF1-interacting nuclear factor 2 N-terminal domain-containing protein n=1 Tax=Poecilia mexicana TaxID=48701 RepID=A0A3B3Z048_9TELE